MRCAPADAGAKQALPADFALLGGRCRWMLKPMSEPARWRSCGDLHLGGLFASRADIRRPGGHTCRQGHRGP
jgi:hypothetical protein